MEHSDTLATPLMGRGGGVIHRPREPLTKVEWFCERGCTVTAEGRGAVIEWERVPAVPATAAEPMEVTADLKDKARRAKKALEDCSGEVD